MNNVSTFCDTYYNAAYSTSYRDVFGDTLVELDVVRHCAIFSAYIVHRTGRYDVDVLPRHRGVEPNLEGGAIAVQVQLVI